MTDVNWVTIFAGLTALFTGIIAGIAILRFFGNFATTTFVETQINSVKDDINKLSKKMDDQYEKIDERLRAVEQVIYGISIHLGLDSPFETINKLNEKESEYKKEAA